MKNKDKINIADKNTFEYAVENKIKNENEIKTKNKFPTNNIIKNKVDNGIVKNKFDNGIIQYKVKNSTVSINEIKTENKFQSADKIDIENKIKNQFKFKNKDKSHKNIEGKGSKNKFIIHPLFLCLAVVFVLIGQGLYFLTILIVVILHEYAHYFVAKCLGYRLNQMCLLPYGAQLNLSKSIFNSNDEILIAIAGPLLNLILAIVCVAFWWLFPITYVYTEMFVSANLIIALFNLLPLAPLDGSRVLLAILNKFGKRVQGYKIINVLNVVVSCVLMIAFIFSAFTNINLSLGIMAIFIFVGAFEKDDAYLYSSLFSLAKAQNLSERPIKIKYFAVTKNISKVKIYRLINQNYYLVIVLLDENLKPIKYIYEGEFDKYFSNDIKYINN